MADARQDPKDEELVPRVARGDRKAFRILYERHEEMVLNVAYRITGNRGDAEDLTQETFLAFFNLAKTFEGRAKFTSWLTRIVINKSINLSKQRKTRTTILKRVFASEDAILAASSEDPDRIQDIFSKIVPEFRAILTLRYVLNYSYQEMAEAFECPLGTLKSKLHHAHERLRDALSRKGATP